MHVLLYITTHLHPLCNNFVAMVLCVVRMNTLSVPGHGRGQSRMLRRGDCVSMYTVGSSLSE